MTFCHFNFGMETCTVSLQMGRDSVVFRRNDKSAKNTNKNIYTPTKRKTEKKIENEHHDTFRLRPCVNVHSISEVADFFFSFQEVIIDVIYCRSRHGIYITRSHTHIYINVVQSG